jgi:hypothetical protein
VFFERVDDVDPLGVGKRKTQVCFMLRRNIDLGSLIHNSTSEIYKKLHKYTHIVPL